MRTGNRTLATNAEWQAWGEKDPLWGVLSWSGRRKEELGSWSDSEFYTQGLSDWNDFRDHWQRYGFDPACIVEIGCGAGRITNAMASDAKSILAIDVSLAMLEYAKSRVQDNRITWIQGNGREIPVESAIATAVFSCHVLQHLPSVNDGLQSLSEAARVLAPGGSLLIHLPLVIAPQGRSGALVRRFMGLWEVLGRLKAAYFRARLRGGKGKPFMQMQSYDLHVVVEHLRALGCTRVEAWVFPMASNDDLHTCILAAKPGGDQ